jgi:inosine-uridine nucleoside N-ribohydrolase
MPDSVQLWLDTDIGSDIDDAVCLAYLLAEPRCKLAGISTVTGEAQKRAMLADAICKAAGRQDVHIWSGAERPLLLPQRQLAAPQAEVLARWQHQDRFEPYEAVRNLRAAIHKHPGKITLLTIGPLTNVGLLFALDPETPKLLKRLVMMAGKFFEPNHLEWNASGDPHATAIVFSSDVPEICVIGLDVTLKCRLSAQECRQRFQGGALDTVADMAEVFFRDRDEITFHDPLAAACVFEPDICAYKRGRVRVEVDEAPLLGQTLFRESEDGPHLVAQEVDVERFFKRYLSTIQRFQRGTSGVGSSPG